MKAEHSDGQNQVKNELKKRLAEYQNVKLRERHAKYENDKRKNRLAEYMNLKRIEYNPTDDSLVLKHVRSKPLPEKWLDFTDTNDTFQLMHGLTKSRPNLPSEYDAIADLLYIPLPEWLPEYKCYIKQLVIRETFLDQEDLKIIGDLTSLEVLNLNAVGVTELTALGNLTKLTSLKITRCPVVYLPEGWLDNCPNLSRLDLSTTQIKTLEGRFVDRLSRLSISNTPIKSLPADYGTLNQLIKLDISYTEISRMPPCFFGSALQYLDISHSRISSLPAEFLTCTSLMFLDASATPLYAFPEASDGVSPKGIKRLDISETPVRQLPGWITDLQSLEFLSLTNCHLNSLDLNIIAHLKEKCRLEFHESMGAIRSKPTSGTQQRGVFIPSLVIDGMDVRHLQQTFKYIKSYYSSPNLVASNEAKVVFLGDTGAGKAWVINRIFNLDEPVDWPDEYNGIRFYQNELQFKGLAPDTRLNIWNARGKAICLCAHHIFMTEGSLYVIVLDGDIEEILFQRALFWLRYIERKTPHSSVVLVLTYEHEIIRSGLAVDLLKSMVQSIDIKGVCVLVEKQDTLSGEYDRQRDELLKMLTEAIKDMPSYTMVIPQAWKAIDRHTRMLLQTQTAISQARFNDICRYHGASDDELWPELMTWLNRTGKCHVEDPGEGVSPENIFMYSIPWYARGIYASLVYAKGKQGLVTRDELYHNINMHSANESFYTRDNVNMLVAAMQRYGLLYDDGKDCVFTVARNFSETRTDHATGARQNCLICAKSVPAGKRLHSDCLKSIIDHIYSHPLTLHYQLEMQIITEDMLSAVITQIISDYAEQRDKSYIRDFVQWGSEGLLIRFGVRPDESYAPGWLLVTAIPNCPGCLHIFAAPPLYGAGVMLDDSAIRVAYARDVIKAFKTVFKNSAYGSIPAYEAYIERRLQDRSEDIPLSAVENYYRTGRQEYFCAKLGKAYRIADLLPFLLVDARELKPRSL